MIDLGQMRVEVIRPALKAVDLWSEEAEELVLYTGYVESLYKYVAQVGGPARSFWQVEPATARDHYSNYLKYRDDLQEKVNRVSLRGPIKYDEELTLNMAYAVVMARLVYRRSPLPLPACGDTQGQAHIWKIAYNTPLGAGTELKFIELVEAIK